MQGTVYPPGEATPIAARVEVDAPSADPMAAVRAELEDGRRFAIPIDALRLEGGGFDADFVFCRPRDQSFTIAVSDARLLETLSAHVPLVPSLESELAKVSGHRRGHRRARRLGIGLVLVGLALIGVAIAMVPRMLAGSIDGLPVSVDQTIGDAAAVQVSASGAPVTDPRVTGFVDQVIARLAPHAATPGFTFRATVVDDDTVNAFALPGGRMVIFSGLIREASSPDQVAGVLAHEMAHVTLRHGLRNVAHRAGLMLAVSLLLGDAGQWVELAADAAVLAQSNDYSRDQEAAADAEGVRMMMAAGLDPNGLAEFFDLLREQPGTELPGAMSWLSTHPDHASRVAHVRELARTLEPAPRRPLDVDWPAIQAAAQ